MVDMLAHFTSHLGPKRIQHDFLVLTHTDLSKQNNSNLQAWAMPVLKAQTSYIQIMGDTTIVSLGFSGIQVL